MSPKCTNRKPPYHRPYHKVVASAVVGIAGAGLLLTTAETKAHPPTPARSATTQRPRIQGASEQVLASLRDRYRMLIIVAPAQTDLRYRTLHKSVFDGEGGGGRERDMVEIALFERGASYLYRPVEGTKDNPQSATTQPLPPDVASFLRRQFAPRAGGDGKPHDFAVTLRGKDGHIALHEDKPVTARALFALIDTMPMRQDEMRQRKGTGVAR